MGAAALAVRLANRAAKMAQIAEFLKWNPDSMVVDITSAIGIHPRSTGTYLLAMKKSGAVHISGRARCSSGQMANTWSSGSDVCDDDSETGYEPKITPVAAWAHGSATRYSMGRAV